MQLARSPDGIATALGAADSCEHLGDFAIGNLHALAKAGDIWARGVRMLNTACVGSALMVVDDSIADVQARMSCSSLPHLIELETDMTPRTISRVFARFCVLTRMAGELAGDALVPLQRRIGVTFDAIGKLAA